MRRLAAVVLLLLTPGCYTTGLRFPASVRSVCVPVFGNETYIRGIEFDLTERIRVLLYERTTVALTATEAEADAVLRGKILVCDFPVLVGGRDPKIQEGAARVIVDASLVDRATGRVLGHVHGEEEAEFTTGLNENRETALADVIDELAWKIIQGLSQDSREEGLRPPPKSRPR